jgi:pSer/pThr/pTyr-binding forkhead associated (FHA) protein
MESSGAGKLRLKVVGGNATGAEIQIDDELLIGRLAEGAGNLAEDIEISRRHARIARTSDTEYRIEDLGSTNGTIVNGRRIAAPEVLMTGDKIEIGQTTLVVQYSAAFPGAETPRAGTSVPTSAAAPEPAEAPVEEPAEAPAEALAEAPVEEPAEAPVEEALAVEAPPEVGEPEPEAPEPEAPEHAPAGEQPGVGAADPMVVEPPVVEGLPATEQVPPGDAPAGDAVPAEAAPAADVAPPAALSAEPAPAEAASVESAPVPPLALRLEVDFDAGEVVLRLDDESEPVRFVHEDGRWRIADPG